jgi:acyl-homoserine lactone acylase PvdQ
MLTATNTGLLTFKTEIRKMQEGISLFKDWTYEFTTDSVAASVFAAWEFAIATHLHEKKIPSPVIRRAIYSYPGNQSWVFKQIQRWAGETASKDEVCQLEHFNFDNTCQEFMAFTFLTALKDIEGRRGEYSSEARNWEYGKVATTRLIHVPFSKTPLKFLFE